MKIRTQKRLGKGLKKYFCPFVVMYSKKLTSKEKMLACVIATFMKMKDGCYASNRYLGELLGGTSPKRVANLLSSMRKKGWVKTLENDGRKRRLELTVPALEAHNDVPGFR